MCTGGRIRLFWGVSPDFMVIALTSSHNWFSYHLLRYCVFHNNEASDKKTRANGSPNYIYILYRVHSEVTGDLRKMYTSQTEDIPPV